MREYHTNSQHLLPRLTIKLKFFIFSAALFCTTEATPAPFESEPQENISSQVTSTYDDFAEQIFQFHNSCITIIRESYPEQPLYGLKYGSAFNSYGWINSNNYSVIFDNITIRSSDTISRVFSIQYNCVSATRLDLKINNQHKQRLRVESQVKMQHVQTNNISEGTFIHTLPLTIYTSYKLKTNNTAIKFIGEQASLHLNVTIPLALILLDASFRSQFTSKIESFLIQSFANEENKKTDGNIFSQFSKTTCNKLSNEEPFRKIIMNDFQQLKETKANVTIRSIVLESVHNISDVTFDFSFAKFPYQKYYIIHEFAYFSVKLGKLKIRCKYLQRGDKETKNLQFFVNSLKIYVRHEETNLQMYRIHEVEITFEEIYQKETSDNLQVRQYVQKIVQETLQKAIFDRFQAGKLYSS